MRRFLAVLVAGLLASCAADDPPLGARCETCSKPGDCEAPLKCVQGTCVETGCMPSGNNVFSPCADCFTAAAPATSPTPKTCVTAGSSCSMNGQCCSLICMSDDDLCHDACTAHSQCKSKCCAFLKDGSRACASANFCP